MKQSIRKKLSALIAAASLFASVLIPYTANAAFSDVPEDSKYKTAITTLSKLNVINGYEDGTFGPEKSITRAEFTKLVVYLLNLGDLTTPITQFKDVSQDHWANANIKTAFDLGIINGYSDTEFGPDDPVTYEQALKMVVCMLGYQADAEAKGGYPEGYRAESITLDLQKSISGVEYTANAPRGVVAQIMYNALEVKLREQNGKKWETTDKTLLNDYLDVYKLKGTVVGVEKSTTADCQAALSPGQFAIDEDRTGEEYVIDFTEYTESLTTMNAYLGKTVQIYYRQEHLSTDRFLVEIDDETYNNKEISVSSFDIASYSELSLKYYPDDSTKTSTVKFDKGDFTVRYNGRAVSENVDFGGTECTPIKALDYWLDPDSEYFIYGSVRIIDSGADGTYNIVDIYDYDNIVALSTPVSPDYKISDKTVAGLYLTLDPESIDYKYTLTRDGSDISVTSIKPGDVLTVAANLDYDFLTVYATSKSVSGTITAVNTTAETAEDRTISIDNVKYHVSKRFLEYMEKKEQKALETGVQITAYTDHLGTLEWGTITKSTAYYPYAYVVDATEDNEKGYLKLFAPTSTTGSSTSFSSSTSYKVKNIKIQESNPKLNGKKSSSESIIAALKANAEGCNPDKDIKNISGIKLTGYNQLIKVAFNSSGEIADVITFDPDNTGTNNDENNKLVLYKQMDPSAKYYVASSAIKESATGTTYYGLKSTTPLFVIPKDRTNVDAYSLKSAITTNSLIAEGNYYLDAYDLSTTKFPSLLLAYNTNFKSGTQITRSAAYKLLSENIKQEYDSSENETYDMLYTYNSATTVSKTKISNEYKDDFADLVKGDVLLNGTDGDKLADSVMVALKFDDIKRILDGYATPVKGEEDKYEYYNWREEQEQTKDNNWQKYVFDFRYPKDNLKAPTDNYWITGGNSTNICSRAFMCNIMQVLTDENCLYVTRDGFDDTGTLNESDYFEVKVSSSTKIVRYDADEDEFTPYVKGTESTALTVNDLKDAENYGINCSKVLITYVTGTSSSSVSPTAKFIVIYGE